jgi:hypothetical protein
MSNTSLANSIYEVENINGVSIFDEELTSGLNIIFDDTSFHYCYNENSEEACVTFTKTDAAAEETPSELTTETLADDADKQSAYTQELEALPYASTQQKEKFVAIWQELSKNTNVENAFISDNGLSVLVDYIAGYSGIIAVTPEGDKGGFGIDKKAVEKITKDIIKNSSKNSSKLLRAGDSQVGNKKVLAFMAQHWSWGDNDDVPLIANLLEANGYDVTRIIYDEEGSGDLSDFKNWDRYGIVLISTHGLSGSYRDRTGYGKSSNITILQTNIKVTPKDNQEFIEELKAGRLYVGKSKYYITQEFVNHYNDKFPNSFVYVSACKGAKHNYMANAFLEHDAGAYVSWSDNVKVSFAQENGLNMFNSLLSEQTGIYDIYKIPENYNGYEGYKTGIKEVDPDKEPAELVVFTRNNVYLEISRDGSIESALHNRSYDIDGEFSYYDFEGVDSSFDWVFKWNVDNNYYQLQGNKPTQYDVFGWKEVKLSNVDADWYMFALGEDVDGDGSLKFDWIILPSDKNVHNQAYKLSGVNDNGTFKYSDVLDVEYDISSNAKEIKFR